MTEQPPSPYGRQQDPDPDAPTAPQSPQSDSWEFPASPHPENPQPSGDDQVADHYGHAAAEEGDGTERTERLSFRYDEPVDPPTPAAGRSRMSSGVVAGLVAAALVAGLVGGVAGAAGFGLLDDGTSGAAATRTVDNRPVSVAGETLGDTAPADGTPEAVAAGVLPSVVKINVASATGSGSGSGIVLSSDGEILTNNHVVEAVGDDGADASLSVSFNDGTSAPATVVGTDPLSDLAVIQAEGVDGLTPASIGSSAALDVGEEVVAIGSPFGLAATVTSGIVSALNRPVSVGETANGGDTTYPAIQTDAAINPGNSGGPLVNIAGEVIGINSSIRTASSAVGEQGGSVGLGFAIPISNVLPIVDQLRAGETATHARLGVSVGTEVSDDGLVSGASIQSVEEGSAAAAAGIEVGDIVTRVDDLVITDSESLVATIRGYRPGDEVEVTFVRDGETETAQATLASDEGVVAP